MARYRRFRKRRSERYELLRYYRPAIQVCPRRCGFSERARHDLIVKTGLSGRAKLTAKTRFETESCPNDGARLTRECARCRKPIYAPVVDHCQFCGVPQPWAEDRRAAGERSSIRYWRGRKEKNPEHARRSHDPAESLYKTAARLPGGGKIDVDVWVLDGDIAQLDVDAVISNDDVDGQMWSQSARSIKDAAGETVEREAQEEKPFRLGDAWTTKAGDLNHLDNIIHVASMGRYGIPSTEGVRRCLENAFRLAIEKGYESLGLTAFGTGPSAITRGDWFSEFAATTVELFKSTLHFEGEEQGGYPESFSIVLVLFEPRKFERDTEQLRQAFRDAWARAGSPSNGMPERPAEE